MISQPARIFHYVQSFSCLADRCEDNCCHSWRVSVSEQRAEAYKQTFPEIPDLIASDAHGFRMNQDGNGQCIALQKGRCSIHARAGEEALPETCATFPRMNRHFSRFTVQSATMSCPEVARLILFGDSPFRLEGRAEHHETNSLNSESHLDQLDLNRWEAITLYFSEQVRIPHYSVHQTLAHLRLLASHLEGLPYDAWMKASAGLTSLPSESLLNHAPAANDELLGVLIDILTAPSIPQRMRRRVMEALDNRAAGPPDHRYLTLKPAFAEIARTYADSAMAPTLKLFIDAEMTRIGFPFISSTKAGRDYGVSLSEWAATLAIRTLALRLLLLAHYDDTSAQHMEPEQLVDLVYRYCRAASHNRATTSELALRHKMCAKE